jgi:wyosine [tRNA(Phe)-imidazoG37] synthetase (radical SAM superfamily)
MYEACKPMTKFEKVEKEFKHVYGPVPSRRLGQSLGIDPIPLKTCNWNCVYCQLGRTRPVVNERKAYFPPQAILTQVERTLAEHKPEEIDWVTFVGSGEPTLHVDLGWMIRHVKALTDLPVAVITNGALMYMTEVRDDLTAADAILPSLDAGSAELYRKINRPHPEVTFERHLQGLIAFSHEYQGLLWPEVMLVSHLNDTEEALGEIANALRRIRTDEVHINLPTRPPAETWIQRPDEESLMRATAMLGDVAHVVHPVRGTFDLSGSETVLDAVIGIITRHPMQEEELRRTLDQWALEDVGKMLTELETSGRARPIERYGITFWSATSAFYQDEAPDKTSAPDYR